MNCEIRIRAVSHLGWLPALKVPEFIDFEWLDKLEVFLLNHEIKGVVLEHKKEFVGNGALVEEYKLHIPPDCVSLTDGTPKCLYVLNQKEGDAQLGVCLTGEYENRTTHTLLSLNSF